MFYANQRCKFMRRRDTRFDETQSSIVRGIGIWTFSGFDGECYFYPSLFKVDPALFIARSSNIIVTVLGVFCMAAVSNMVNITVFVDSNFNIPDHPFGLLS